MDSARKYRVPSQRRFSWLVLGVGLVIILAWTFCQRSTWEIIRNLTDEDRLPPAWMDRSEDISRQDRLLPGLTSEMLEVVKDNSPVFSKEKRLVMKIWNQLNGMTVEEIEKASLGKVLFAQYFKQPETYRGSVIRIRGTVRRAVRQEIPETLQKSTENPECAEDPDFGYDFDHYFELWIQPDDNAAEPVLVNTLEVPAELPLDQDIYVPVVIDGLFFKLYLYEGQDDLYSEPMFYAKSALWYRDLQKVQAAAEAKEKAQKPLRVPFVFILGGAILLAGVILRVIEKRTQVEPGEPLPEKFELPETFGEPEEGESKE
ncbi:MAG: hypothetical protein IJQ31_16720 [Thermoguttaceae bacterium]|nr:hypothetical protein [Thermoguttaceae bacterium]